jgi:O-antigen ligase
MFIWLLLLIVYLPFQIALNPGAGFDLASIRVFIVLLFVVWLGSIITRKLSILSLRGGPTLSQGDAAIPRQKLFFTRLLRGACAERMRSARNDMRSISLFLFLILAGFSLVGTENVFWGIRKLVFFLSIFPLYFLTVALADNWLKVKKIIFILVVSGGSIALIGLGQFLAQFVFSLERVYGFWAWHVVPVFSGFNFGALILAYPSWLVNLNGQTVMRAFSLFSDPHMLSFYLGLILPLVVILFLKIPKKFLLLTFYFLLFTVLLLTFTRGAYISIIITFLSLAGLIWQYLKAKKIALLLCLSLLIFIIPVTPFADRFYSSFNLIDGSNIGRLEMWQQAGQTGQQYFWQGVGLGNYSLFVDANLGYRNPITAHNFYLDLFSELGIFALIIWLILILGTIGQLFLKLKKSNLSSKQQYILIGLIGSLIYFLSHSFFETAVYNPIILALLMVILGLSTVAIRYDSSS